MADDRAQQQVPRLGPVQLAVASLERATDFYGRVVGLQAIAGAMVQPVESADEQAGARTAAFGSDGRALVELIERPGAAAAAPGSTGLFHFALLVPDRAALARWFAHALADRVAIDGAADHVVSEALYLHDPDGHGIEIYADRPRALWQGRVAEQMSTLPLDGAGLLAELDGQRPDGSGRYEGLPPGTRIGHLHLKVADVAAAGGFYGDLLGLELTAALGGRALFFAAGGYHHHIAVNDWQSAGGSPPAPGSAAMIAATVSFGDEAQLAAVLARAHAAGSKLREHPAAGAWGRLCADPSGNRLLLSLERKAAGARRVSQIGVNDAEA